MALLDTIFNHALSKRVLPFNRIQTKSGPLKLRGLTKPMKRIFFKDFKRPLKRKTHSSKRTGKKVHRQVEYYIKNGKLPDKPHAFALQAVKFLSKKHLGEILASEVPLLSAKGKFLTHADIICENKETNELTVVSLKTGYSNPLNSGKANCSHLEGIKNSYLTHHQVQLGLEVACVERDYGVKVAHAYILYVGFGQQKKLKVVPLADWARKMQNHLLETMAGHRKGTY
jgi:hypothetical protein